jgi:hypothetical protein
VVKVIHIAVMVMIPGLCNAQYRGGTNDGVATGLSAQQNRLPDIYTGGANDGHDARQANGQNTAAAIYLGGSNDGTAIAFAGIQNALPSIYLGGINDGVASAFAVVQNDVPAIYTGGPNDGVDATQASAQNALPDIYRGGGNDGVSSLIALLENTTPNIYTGGTNDGYAIAVSQGQNSSFPLPLNLLRFDGNWFNEDAILSWQTADEQGLDRFELERSEGGGSFHFIARIEPGDNPAGDDYRYTDVRGYELPADFFLYRLKLLDQRGGFRYSGIVKLSKDKTAPVIAAYPNPTKGRLTLAIVDGQSLTGYSFVLSSSDGKIVQRESVATAHTAIDLNGLPAAAYHLVVFKDGHMLQHFTILLTP